MTVAVVIARGGSKRIERKNVKDFCGLPLVQWSIKQAKYAKLVDKVIVSTDDDEIADIAKSEGVPVVRRETGTVATEGQGGMAFQHTIHAIRAGMVPGVQTIDQIVTILPTTPTRMPDDIDNMIRVKDRLKVPEVTVWCESLETIVFRKTSPNRCEKVIWDKHSNYLSGGGNMSVLDVDYYLDLYKGKPVMDKDIDADPDKYVQVEFVYHPLKSWQSVELDLPEHWELCEAIMVRYILNPLGRNCYESGSLY
jgi:CMP-N-acetylneuraminic acid synthetase